MNKLEAAKTAETEFLYSKTASNPLHEIADILSLAKIAKNKRA